MKINVVVVTYNRKDLLRECLDALLNQTYKKYKIILVDNACSDGTYEMLNNGYMDKIIYVKLNKNIGGAGGFYEGMKKSIEIGSDYTWIMDDDTIPNSTALENLVKYACDNKDKRISYLSSYVYDLSSNQSNIPQFICDNLISAATFVSLLISNNAIKSIGLPMRDYFIWGDDTEYTLRLTKYYGNAYFVKDSKVLHKRVMSGGLSIINETNLNRINFWYYNIRNNLNNYRTYYGFKKYIRQILYYDYLLVCCLFKKGVKYRYLKCKTIIKGINAYLFKKFDYNAFKNRFDINVKYKGVSNEK